MKSKNTICLWFDKDAQEAANFSDPRRDVSKRFSVSAEVQPTAPPETRNGVLAQSMPLTKLRGGPS